MHYLEVQHQRLLDLMEEYKRRGCNKSPDGGPLPQWVYDARDLKVPQMPERIRVERLDKPLVDETWKLVPIISGARLIGPIMRGIGGIGGWIGRKILTSPVRRIPAPLKKAA